jgi:D-threo-aldose 1-dehydrogenase
MPTSRLSRSRCRASPAELDGSTATVRRLVIPGTNIETSRFIFGTSGIFRVGSTAARRRLLEAAVDHGFLHFDTAPYYGFGTAERDLASVLKAHPEVKVTTKVGLYSPGGEDQSSASVLIRKAGGKIVPGLCSPSVSFDLDRARRSLEGSLRRLGRDYVELYMLHEPDLRALNTPAWVEWLESQRRTGRIGSYGLALTVERLEPFLAAATPIANVVQVHDSLVRREADVLTCYHRPLQITYGYVSAARASGDTTNVPDILRLATERNPHGPIIVSTKRIDRLPQYAQAREAVNGD